MSSMPFDTHIHAKPCHANACRCCRCCHAMPAAPCAMPCTPVPAMPSHSQCGKQSVPHPPHLLLEGCEHIRQVAQVLPATWGPRARCMSRSRQSASNDKCTMPCRVVSGWPRCNRLSPVRPLPHLQAASHPPERQVLQMVHGVAPVQLKLAARGRHS